MESCNVIILGCDLGLYVFRHRSPCWWHSQMSQSHNGNRKWNINSPIFALIEKGAPLNNARKHSGRMIFYARIDVNHIRTCVRPRKKQSRTFMFGLVVRNTTENVYISDMSCILMPNSMCNLKWIYVIMSRHRSAAQSLFCTYIYIQPIAYIVSRVYGTMGTVSANEKIH